MRTLSLRKVRDFRGELLTKLILLALFLGHSGEFLHAYLVPHSTCPEHGEAIESHGGTVDQQTSQDASVTIDSNSSLDAHECTHCCFFSQARKKRGQALVVAKSHVIPQSPVFLARGIVSSAIRFPKRPIYLLAPKNSPPLA